MFGLDFLLNTENTTGTQSELEPFIQGNIWILTMCSRRDDSAWRLERRRPILTHKKQMKFKNREVSNRKNSADCDVTVFKSKGTLGMFKHRLKEATFKLYNGAISGLNGIR